ncbi:MAG: hypothetical protein CV087_15165 [Candidatus Brocadia sp. WS118]|nr:MAG: hypothetical protein CV087_15165 [Candidatus Brocadia sp. WS118]
MNQKASGLLIALLLMLVMRVLDAQDFDRRLFGKWQGTGVFNVLKLDLSSKGNYTIERDNKTIKSGRYKASAGKILFYPETGSESDESGFYELKGMDQLTVETDLSGKVQWLRLTGIASKAFDDHSSVKQTQTGIFAVELPDGTGKDSKGSSEIAGKSDATTAAGPGNDSIDGVKSFFGTVKKYVETAISKTKETGQSIVGREKLKVSNDKVEETWQKDPVSDTIKKGQDAIGESQAKARDVTQTVNESVSGTVEAAKKKVEGMEAQGSEVVSEAIEDTLNHSTEAQQGIFDEARAYNSELSEELTKKAVSASEKTESKESGSSFFKTFGGLFKKSESGPAEKNPPGKNSLTNTQSNSESVAVSEPKVKAPTKTVKLSELNLSSGPGIVLIDDKLATKAKKAALKWKKDAVLVEIHAKAVADGMVNLNVTPDGAAFVFFPPSTPVEGLTVMLTKEGSLVSVPLKMSQSDRPLPDQFLSLPEAVAYARQVGFNDHSFGARLKVFETGLTGWTFMSFGQAILSKAMVIDARTGAAMTYHEATGLATLERLAESMKQPRPLPNNAAKTYGPMRREADAIAAKWHPEMRLIHIGLLGEVLRGQISINIAHFDYLSPQEQGRVRKVRVEVRDGKIRSFTTKHDLATLVKGQPMAQNILDADDALQLLLKRTGQNGGQVGMEAYVYVVGPDGRESGFFGGGIPGIIYPNQVWPDLDGKTVWAYVNMSKQNQVIDPEWIYIDAVTGKPL